MPKDITLYQEHLPDQFKDLRELDQKEFNGKKYQAIGLNFESKIYEYIRFKDGQYQDCRFDNCKFICAGLSGTHFIDTKLKDCAITDSNLQFCEFSHKSRLQGAHNTTIIESSNLSQSMFHNAVLQNLLFRSTTVSQARFINTDIIDVAWQSCTLQDNIFDNVYMENVSLVGCNVEYSVFKDMRMKNVALPLHQLPYAFGLLECLRKYPNEITITAVSSDKEPLLPDEYISLLPELFSYYISMNDYFPAINIVLFMGNYERAEDLINAGTQHYIQQNDFRKLKAICKLIANNSFYDKHYKTLLYYKLVEYYNTISVSEYEKYQYTLHINDIKEILTGFEENLNVQLYLKTNISSAYPEQIGIFYQLIEECFRDYGISDDEYSIEIRHNSDPLSFWVVLSQNNFDNVIQAIGILMSIVANDPSILTTAIGVLANIATLGDFVMHIVQSKKSKKKTAIPDNIEIADSHYNFIEKKRELLKKQKISVEVALPFFKFSYQKELQCKG